MSGECFKSAGGLAGECDPLPPAFALARMDEPRRGSHLCGAQAVVVLSEIFSGTETAFPGIRRVTYLMDWRWSSNIPVKRWACADIEPRFFLIRTLLFSVASTGEE